VLKYFLPPLLASPPVSHPLRLPGKEVEMAIVDTHVHVALHTYEPVEILLTQMQYNNVEKTVLVQSTTTTDNTYVIECMRRFPGRFSVVCRVEEESPKAVEQLEHWHREGADSLRLRNFHRSPGEDPLAIWRKAQELGMPVSVGGPAEVFASQDFSRLLESLPDLKMILEHLGGMGINAIGESNRPPDSQFRQVLRLAGYPNTYIKIHGMGEICSPPFPYKEIPPYVKMAYDAFGPQRMMWGSDYPRVVLREGYRNALRFTMEQMAFCSHEDLEWIFGKTALSVWKFSSGK
jgi:L-fuconolactonase